MQTELFDLPDPLTLAEEDSPQYKAVTHGLSYLSPSELLCLTIQGAGLKALTTVRELLSKAKNNLRELGKLSVHELTQIDGIGHSKALAIAAAIELGKRREMAQALELPVIRASQDIATYLQIKISELKREVFCVMFLNRANRIMHFETLSEGGITGTVADTRIILRRAIEVGCIYIILGHNHPSGNLKPSRADEELTIKIKEAAKYLDIQVLDHVIVSDQGYYSFADDGKM